MSGQTVFGRIIGGIFGKLVSLVLAGLIVVSGHSLAIAGELTPPPDEPVASADPTPTEDPAPTEEPPPASEEPAPAEEPLASEEPAPEPGPTDSYIVTFVSGSSEAERQSLLDEVGALELSSIPQLRMYSADISASGADALRAEAAVSRVESDKVRAVEATPSDPSYAGQWALPKIGWDNAYGTIDPAGSATVAVLDTGVDATADLDGKLVAGTSTLAGVEGTQDPNGHGTAMASIVAAATDNGTGIAGVGYDGVSVMPVRVLGADGLGQDSDIVSGVVWAADHGADVILMSFSNPGYSFALQSAVDYAWSQGAVLVAATGNDGVSSATYPAGTAKVVGVSATNQDDALWSGSNHGAGTFLAAPGVDIATGSGSVTGTSASAAIVAGAAALVAANDFSASNGVVVGRLARNADPAGTVAETGNGRVNVARAMTDSSTDPVVPQGVAGDGGPVVGPYVAAGSSTVTVTVTDASTSLPIGGALVTCVAGCNGAPLSQFGTTNASGISAKSYEFQGNAGTLSFSVTAAGYGDGAINNVGVSNTTPASRAIALTPSNTPPAATIPTFSPLAPKTNDLLAASSTISDSSTTAQGTFSWKITRAGNTCVIGSPSTTALAASGSVHTASLNLGVAHATSACSGTALGLVNPAKGDVIQVEVVPYDGTVNGTSRTASVTVANTAPVVDAVVIDQASPTTGTTLTTTVSGATDADGDTVTLSYQWFKNDVLITGAAGASLNLGTAGNGDRGDVITVFVTPSDGSVSGTAVPSAPVTVGNTAPVAIDDAGATAEDSAVAVDVIANDTDVDHANTELSVVEDSLVATNGAATLDVDGRTIHFTPGANLHDGNVDGDGFTVTYLATDGDQDSSVATLTIGVSAVNDAPVAIDDAGATAEDSAVAVDVIANDTDVDHANTELSVVEDSLVATNGAATLDVDGRTIHFTPGANLHDGNVDGDGFTVTYLATDGDQDSSVATLTIGVSAVNDAPVAIDDAGATAEDSAVAVDVIANDTDVDHANTELSVVEDSLVATNGAATLDVDGRTIHFTPGANLHDGNVDGDGFTVTYLATDGDQDSSVATLTIGVSAVNDAPVAIDDAGATAEDSAVAVDVIANDTDVDHANTELSVVEDSLVATNGAATLDVDGRTIHFTPGANLHDGNVDGDGFTVTYLATDGDQDSSVATLTIGVSAVNDAPVVEEGSATTAVEGSVTELSAAFGDIDGAAPYSATIDWGPGAPETATVQGSTVTGSHTYLDSGSYSAVIVVTDSGTTNGVNAPASSASYTIPVTVTNVAPEIEVVELTGLNPVTGTATVRATFTDPGEDTYTGGFVVTHMTGLGPVSVPVTDFAISPTGAYGSGAPGVMTGKVSLPPGCFTVGLTATVSDGDGGSDTESEMFAGTDIYTVAFRQPVSSQEFNVVKGGSVVPVKVKITRSCGDLGSVTTPELHVQVAQGVDEAATPDDGSNVVFTESVSNADIGTRMRIADGGYIFNLSTKKDWANKKFTVRIRLGGPSAPSPVIARAVLDVKK